MDHKEETCCELVDDLKQDLSQTAILYTSDGFAYYARIQDILHHRIALLIPGAGQTEVIIRHPDQTFVPQGQSIILEDFTYLDVCTVVAVTSPLFAIPPGFAVL